MTVIDFREAFSEYDKEKPSLKDACNKNMHNLTGVKEQAWIPPFQCSTRNSETVFVRYTYKIILQLQEIGKITG